jgi:hypothetical protein
MLHQMAMRNLFYQILFFIYDELGLNKNFEKPCPAFK